MDKKIENEKPVKYPSLYEKFQPGDRVYRKINVDNGKTEEYEGIIMAMDNDKMEIYWDTIDGEYNPSLIDDDFTLCSVDEVLNGTEEYSPMKRKHKGIIEELFE
ncbi:MAG: hypothetical protein R6U21_03155 [Thermoplasmatota archaeon]